jgi:hypothetical protein
MIRVEQYVGWKYSSILEHQQLHQLPSSSRPPPQFEMASSEPSVYAQLIGMGVDEPISKEASRRFREIEQAANWAFDHGQTVREPPLVRSSSTLTISSEPPYSG